MVSIGNYKGIIAMVTLLILLPIILSVLASQYEQCKLFRKGCVLNKISQDYKESIEFTVSSQEGWQDTGVFINKGDYISIKSSGIIVLGSDGRKADSDGEIDPPKYVPTVFAELTDKGFCTYLICRKDIRAHTLVGTIGMSDLHDYASGFQVGSDFSIYAEKSGNLFLGFNDLFIKDDRSGLDEGGAGDNSGQFNAVIIAKKPKNLKEGTIS